MIRSASHTSRLVESLRQHLTTHSEVDEEESNEQPPSENTSLLPNESANESDQKRSNVPYRDGISGPRFHFLFWSLIFGSTIAFFDTTLMASSHPVITSYFHASNAASWLSTVFYLTSTVAQPVFGRVSDTIGRRPVLLFGIIMFFTSTVCCGAAGSIESFIAARALCGIGAGGVVSLASIITSDIVKIEYRGIYQSYYNLVNSSLCSVRPANLAIDSRAPLRLLKESSADRYAIQAFGTGNGLGAAMGGYLCDKLGWRAAFYIQLPFIGVYGVLAILSCPNNLGPSLARTQGKTLTEAFQTFDTYGTICMMFTVSGLILGVNLGGNIFAWTHPFVIGSLIVSLIAGVGLVFVERKAERPILPLKLFTTIPVANVICSNFVACMTINTVFFNVPLYLQAVRQTSPTKSGLYLFPPLVGASITAVSAGIYMTITRRMRPPMVLGVISAVFGAIAVSFLSADTPARLVPWLIPFVSIGQGFFFPAATIAVLALNTQEDQAVATTTLGLMRSLGSILGVALSSWILQNALPIYLNKYVTDPDSATKRRIIRNARESIRYIHHLDSIHKKQVINAYALSLRAVFLAAILFAVVSALLILPVKLPTLPKQEDMDKPEDGALDTEGDETSSVEEEDNEEQALLATPTRTISRTITSGTSRSRTTLSRRSTSFGAASFGRTPMERRASFDTSF